MVIDRAIGHPEFEGVASPSPHKIVFELEPALVGKVRNGKVMTEKRHTRALTRGRSRESRIDNDRPVPIEGVLSRVGPIPWNDLGPELIDHCRADSSRPVGENRVVSGVEPLAVRIGPQAEEVMSELESEIERVVRVRLVVYSGQPGMKLGQVIERSVIAGGHLEEIRIILRNQQPLERR